MKKLVLAFGMTLVMSTAALAASGGTGAEAGGAYPGSEMYNAPLESIDDDNNIGNANETGKNVTDNDGNSVGDVIKSDNMVNNAGVAGNQRTHGEYQNNTNSCASCHQTHTAASRQLLFKDGVYATCTACHDGTLGFYNVYANGAMASTAGTFGGDTDGNSSVHLANGTMEVKAAPGGNTGATDGHWTGEFTCASCHAPHGSYSDRLLHYNPNEVQSTSPAQGGNRLENIAIVDALPTATAASAANFLVRTTASAAGETSVAGTTPIIVLYKKVNTGTSAAPVWVYQRDTTPWVYGYGGRTDYGTHYTNLIDTAKVGTQGNTAGGVNPSDIAVAFGKAFFFEKKAGEVAKATITTGNISQALIVKLQKTGFPMEEIADFGGVKITKVNSGVYDESGVGVAIGKYCAACHTDYRGAASDGEYGVWSKAFRHTTNNDSYTCLKCHFAHGTDVQVMMDSKDNTVADLVAKGKPEAEAKAYLLDKNPSSALKRYTNMAVCWKCHTTSHAEQIINNDKYWNNWESPLTDDTTKVPQGPNNW